MAVMIDLTTVTDEDLADLTGGERAEMVAAARATKASYEEAIEQVAADIRSVRAAVDPLRMELIRRNRRLSRLLRRFPEIVDL